MQGICLRSFWTSGLSRATQQSARPKAESSGEDGEENEHGVARQAPPFLEDAPYMRQGDQAEDRAGCNEVRFHAFALMYA
jgi:hypothetical protein